MSSNNTVTIYGAGGAGIDILTKLMRTDLSELANVKEAYVDGSRSNVSERSVQDPDKWYFLEGVDGAGKIRKTNYDVTNRSISDILFKLKPSDLNILIFSASGGSGSVIGPKLIEALYAQNKAVLVFLVGSTESGNTTENTMKTISSLRNIAIKNNQFCNVCYESNENNLRNAEVDAIMIATIRAVLDLYSGKHHGLDSADVLTWAKPVLGAGVSPELGLLDVFQDRDDAVSVNAPISVAELYGDNKPVAGTIPADYNTFGTRKRTGEDSLYFVIHTDGLNEILMELRQTFDDYEQRRAARDKKSKAAQNFIRGDVQGDGMEL
ncbi:tubulin PhuZ [Klebsiella phage KpLz-2_45]|uniref:tubulin PhuZ n=1 Tax=Klebsiella phage KpLz-2_45 TaxID=2698923 RepID=UPI001F139B6F|nr:tubulin PhuZ [Klebsiella phage KpLz-2_45]UKS72121.1 hypothetical protein KpLz245_2550 [Klebsiella phage KpLz-2_45]DAX11237.1 MAG TPA: tubulin [Bacteriophage sp.]